METWRERHKSKFVGPEEAVALIRPGNRVVVGHACGSPEILLKALSDRKQAYHDVEIVHMVSMGAAEYCLPGMEQHFIHNSLFAGAASRRAIQEGRASFTPAHFSRIPGLFTEGILPVDVALCVLSPPDYDGYCSFGISVDYTKAAAESARLVIAEITPHMPRTLGETRIHISDIDCIVECDSRPIILPRPEISEVDRKIGAHCAELVKDGDCLQLGIGALPDSILGFLKHKKDLGIHSEMFSDGVVDLVESGVITCARKNIHTGKLVATFLMGTERLYRFVHENPMVAMFPVNYTNHPNVIAGNDNVVSINSTIQVDLTGQAASETIGYRQFSGTGGQADFIQGAAWSKGGRSILAFPSATAGGRISRIVSRLDEGAAVSTTRNDIHYVVTEYGIADLRGKSIAQRAAALIRIAHPDFQDELKAAFRRIYEH